MLGKCQEFDLQEVYLKDSVDLDNEWSEDESEGEMEAKPGCGTEGVRGSSNVYINTDIGQFDAEQNDRQHVPCGALKDQVVIIITTSDSVFLTQLLI